MINSCVNWRMESVVLRWSRITYANTRNHVLPLQNHIHAYKFYFVCLVFFSFSAGSPRSFCSPMNTWLRCTLNAIWSRVLPENITTHISNFRSTTKLRSHSSHRHTHVHPVRDIDMTNIWKMVNASAKAHPPHNNNVHIDIWPFYVDH